MEIWEPFTLYFGPIFIVVFRKIELKFKDKFTDHYAKWSVESKARLVNIVKAF